MSAVTMADQPEAMGISIGLTLSSMQLLSQVSLHGLQTTPTFFEPECPWPVLALTSGGEDFGPASGHVIVP